jgi:transglutaminase-like putative cysteine protease
VLLKITHQTDLAYSDMISESVMELRMAPSQEFDQHRLSFYLAIGPAAAVNSYFDWLGNTIHFYTIRAPHNRIRIVATSIVETNRRHVQPEQLPDTWPDQREHDYTLYDYLQFGGPIVDSPLLRKLIEDLRPQRGEPLGLLTARIIDLLAERFIYEPGVTTAASPITEMLQHGRGVCQDFTHLMIGMGRALGIPARYVSGFLHPDAEHDRGHTETHAWCELLFPSAGWIGFDPANRCAVADNFVKVGIGRDFRDVPPNRGVFRGNARESIRVAVRSEELAGIPPELAAERFQALPIPTYSPTAHVLPAQVSQQQEQQQQQAQSQQ